MIILENFAPSSHSCVTVNTTSLGESLTRKIHRNGTRSIHLSFFLPRLASVSQKRKQWLFGGVGWQKFLALTGKRLGWGVGDHWGPAPAPSDSTHCPLFHAPGWFLQTCLMASPFSDSQAQRGSSEHPSQLACYELQKSLWIHSFPSFLAWVWDRLPFSCPEENSHSRSKVNKYLVCETVNIAQTSISAKYGCSTH